MNEEVPDQRSSDQAGECEDVGDCVDVFMCAQGNFRQDFGFCRRSVRLGQFVKRTGQVRAYFGVLSGLVAFNLLCMTCGCEYTSVLNLLPSSLACPEK